MTEITTGVDTYVSNIGAGSQTKNFYGTKVLPVGPGTAPGMGLHRILMTPALPTLAGEVVTSATLAIPIKKGWASAKKVIVELMASKSNYRKVTFATQPAATGTPVELTTTAADDSVLTVNVVSLLQQIAAGAPAYGFRISLELASPYLTGSVYGYQSGGQATSGATSTSQSWVLTYTLAGADAVPTGLSPAGGAVGKVRPWLSWSPMDDQQACRAQITTDFTERSSGIRARSLARPRPWIWRLRCRRSAAPSSAD